MEDLLASRGHQPQAAAAVNVDLPELAQSHYGVRLRPDAPTPTAEIHVPRGDGPWPVFLYLHGGAWYTGSTTGVRSMSMRIAAAGFLVVSVDYGLAPEQPFPQGLQDCIYAVRWITQNIEGYGGVPHRLAIGGGSCGANLAAAVALALTEDDAQGLDGYGLDGVVVSIRAVVLLWGMLDLQRWISEPHYWAGEVETIAAAYLGPNFTRRMCEPLVSPLRSERLALLPPTYLCCGSEDALLRHSLEMAYALSMVDVPATLSVVESVDHEFLRMAHHLPAAREELSRITGWLHAHV